MADPWKPKTQKVLQDWIDYIYARNKSLTEWEHGFLVGVGAQVRRRGSLTEVQEQRLEGIYVKTK